MLSLLKNLGASWEQSRDGLYSDLEQIETILNRRWAATFGGSSVLGPASGGTGTATVFTKGSVVFAGALGAYSQNNSKLFWDNTNYRLGIGTSTPLADLNVTNPSNLAGAFVELRLTSNTQSLYFDVLAAGSGLYGAGHAEISSSAPLDILSPSSINFYGNTYDATHLFMSLSSVGVLTFSNGGYPNPTTEAVGETTGKAGALFVRPVTDIPAIVIETFNESVADRAISVKRSGTENFYVDQNGGLFVSGTGNITSLADAATDIGTSLKRMRDGWFSRDLHIDGLIKFNGTTSAFPALKRASTSIAARLADDSNPANITADSFISNGGPSGTGGFDCYDAGFFYWASRAAFSSPADGQVKVSNNAVSTGVLFDVATDTTLKLRNRANSTDAALTAGFIQLNGNSAITNKFLYITGSLSSATPAMLYCDSALTGIGGAGTETAVGTYLGPSFSLAGNAAHVYTVDIPAATVTLNGHTLTDATSLLIEGAPTNGTTKRAIWVMAGASQFDGTVAVNGATGGLLKADTSIEAAGLAIRKPDDSGYSALRASNLMIANTGGLYTASNGAFSNSASGEWKMANSAGTAEMRLSTSYLALSHTNAKNYIAANGDQTFFMGDEAVATGFNIQGPAADTVAFLNIAKSSGISFVLTTDGTLALRNRTQTAATGNLDIGAKLTKYNNISTAGEGVPAIYSEAITSTQIANVTILTYTPPATAGRYVVSGVITTTSSTNTGTVQLTIDYKDSQGTTHTADIMPLTDAAGVTATTKTGASKEFHANPWRFTIDNSATNIVVKVVITGSVSYTASAHIEQVA